jgi:hypothetical protein
LRRAAILGLLLAPLFVLHLRFAPRQGPFGLDGSYYLQVARSVAEQNRLQTSVALYHEALLPLPQTYTYIPLWPAVLGVAAKGLGLVAAANALPQFFYLLDLVLLYLLAGNMPLLRVGEDTLDAGHVVVLVAGLSFIFFQTTTLPYTEGLAFALALGALLMLEKRPALAGLLAGLSCLARYQMVAVPLAVVLVAALPVIPSAARDLLRGGRGLRSLAALGMTGRFSVGVLLPLVPWFLYVRFHPPTRAAIPLWDEWVHAAGVAGQLGQLARGLGVALNPFASASLWHGFGALVLLVPFALRRHAPLTLQAMAASGLLSVVMLAHFESMRFEHWLFGERHALLFLLAALAGLAVALARGSARVRALALALAGVGCAQGLYAIVTTAPPSGRGLDNADRALVAWLATHAAHAAVLTTNAQILSVYTRNPLHWTDCDVDAATTRRMLALLPIEHVVVYDRERRCRAFQGLGLPAEAVFDDGIRRVTLFGVTRKTASTGAPSRRQTATGWKRDSASATSAFDQSRRKTNITYAGRVRASA